MSALGQKQTSALQKAMSALPAKADMCAATATTSSASGYSNRETMCCLIESRFHSFINWGWSTARDVEHMDE